MIIVYLCKKLTLPKTLKLLRYETILSFIGLDGYVHLVVN